LRIDCLVLAARKDSYPQLNKRDKYLDEGHSEEGTLSRTIIRAFCKTKIFVQNQGMEKFYHRHTVDIPRIKF
jgi:hypothetical protein